MPVWERQMDRWTSNTRNVAYYRTAAKSHFNGNKLVSSESANDTCAEDPVSPGRYEVLSACCGDGKAGVRGEHLDSVSHDLIL